MIKYAFRDEPITIKAATKADPQKIGEALQAIMEANAGKLTPKAVVDAARNSRSPLHKHFEWDDAVAAEAFRLDQAREVIRVVRVEEDDGQQVRAFVSINDGGTAYRAVEEVKHSLNLQDIVLKQALRDLRAFEQRYRDFTDICDLVREARRKVSARMKTATNDARAAA